MGRAEGAKLTDEDAERSTTIDRNFSTPNAIKPSTLQDSRRASAWSMTRSPARGARRESAMGIQRSGDRDRARAAEAPRRESRLNARESVRRTAAQQIPAPDFRGAEHYEIKIREGRELIPLAQEEHRVQGIWLSDQEEGMQMQNFIDYYENKHVPLICSWRPPLSSINADTLCGARN